MEPTLRWDLSGYVAGGSPQAAADGLARDIAVLAVSAASLPERLLAYERLGAEGDHLGAYWACARGLDQTDPAASAGQAVAVRLETELHKVRGGLRQELGRLDEGAFEALLAEPSLSDARFRLEQEREEGRTGLGAAEQALASDLLVDSLHRWGRLADQVFAGLRFEVRGEATTYVRRFDYFWAADPALRQDAWDSYQAALRDKAWLLATCVNGLMGSRLSILRRKGREPLDDAVWRNGMARATLEALIDVVREKRPMIRAYLERKKQLLGLERIGPQDRWAPPPAAFSPPLAQRQIVDRVQAAFARTAPAFAESVGRMRAKGWIDAQPGMNRRGGGFCVFSPLSGEPRIFMNLDGGFYSQAVFAHELGHGVHFEALGGVRPFRTGVSSSLAETASITGEHLFREGVLRDPASTREHKIEAVVAELDTAVNYLLRLPRDFEFECAVYEERAGGDLTEARLCELQDRAHQEWFGDSLGRDPYAWAGDQLLFSTYTDFFNFPYVFGFLLSRRIADGLLESGDGFAEAVMEFLRLSGSMSAEDAARRALGFDLGSRDFWRRAFQGVQRRLDQFEALL